MITSNDFSEYYKTISDAELLNILDNPDEYQPLALKAAEEEFANRQLSDTEIQKARQELIARQAQKEKQREKIKSVEIKIKESGQTFIDTINPIQTGIHSTEKAIRLIVIVFGGILLYKFVKYFKTYLAYVRDISGFRIDSIIYFLPEIFLLIATITFWRRKRIGWMLLMIFLTFSAVGALDLLIRSFNWKSSDFDNLFPRPSPMTHIVQLLFLIAIMYVLCKENMREVFSIDKQKIAKAIFIGVFVAFVLMVVIY